MGPRRCTANRKVDHCTYVQQLFKDFLERNRPQPVIPEVLPKPIKRPLQRFPIDNGIGGGRNNLYQEGIIRNFRRAQDKPSSNPVKEFFAKSDAKAVTVQNNVGHAAYARFKRDGSAHFVKREPSPRAPTRGIMQWLEGRKQARVEQNLLEQKNKKKKADEFLNLPGNFFSGRESIKLPFEVSNAVDKTLMSVGSVFVPPATSTPFDGIPIQGSPIISDPDDLVRNVEVPPKPTIDCERFLEDVATALEIFNSSLCQRNSSTLVRNFRELKLLLNGQKVSTEAVPTASFDDRSSWMDHSLISNHIHNQYRKRIPSPALFNSTRGDCNTTTGVVPDDDSLVVKVQMGRDRRMTESSSESFLVELLRPDLQRKRKTSVEALLTASPPSPKMSQTLAQELSILKKQQEAKRARVPTQSDFDFSFLVDPNINREAATSKQPLIPTSGGGTEFLNHSFFDEPQRANDASQPDLDFSFLDEPKRNRGASNSKPAFDLTSEPQGASDAKHYSHLDFSFLDEPRERPVVKSSELIFSPTRGGLVFPSFSFLDESQQGSNATHPEFVFPQTDQDSPDFSFLDNSSAVSQQQDFFSSDETSIFPTVQPLPPRSVSSEDSFIFTQKQRFNGIKNSTSSFLDIFS